MGHLPVIENVYRATIHWNPEAGVDHAVTVQHFRTELGPADLAGFIDSEVSDHMFEGMRNACAATRLDLLPLDGVAATSTFALSNWVGNGGSGDALIGQAVLVLGRTGLRGGQNRGRLFRPSPLESIVTNGAIVEANRAEIEDAWDQYIQDLTDNGVEWGVASYHGAGHFNNYTEVHVQARLSRIRRRQPTS